jgi:23S rRNA (adenine2503-C2)-methyltransferase
MFEYEQLKSVLAAEPKYRLGQAIKAVYGQSISDWEELTVFPKDLRQKLTTDCPLDLSASHEVSKDGRTLKAVFTVAGGRIEAVLMRHENRNTVCVSTQLGCALACRFCLTGTMGLTRNLEADEMLGQVLYFNRILKADNERVSSVVFMGMGEPLLNYDELMRAIGRLNDPGFLGIGARHISVSTSGIVPGIEKLAREKIQLNLSISLHAADNDLRNELMPINERYPLEVLLKAVAAYIRKTNRRVMIEYILLGGVNDRPRDADKLAQLLKKHLGELYFVNLIPYNDTGKFKAAAKHDVNVFKRILSQSGVSVVERFRYGRDVSAACGQLAKK